MKQVGFEGAEEKAESDLREARAVAARVDGGFEILR